MNFQTAKNLEAQCKNKSIEVISRVSFLGDPRDAIKALQRQDARIIVGMFYSAAARMVMCEAYKHGLYGKKFVWFLIGWYEDNWYSNDLQSINCTLNEMETVLNGHFTTEALMWNQDDVTPTISGLNMKQWIQLYKMNLMNYSSLGQPEGYQEAPLAYDAIWAIAKALNQTIIQLEKQDKQIESFNYHSNGITNVIKHQLQNIDFLGVSGKVLFSEAGDRIAWTLIEQMKDGIYYKIGFYDIKTENLTWNSNSVFWLSKKPPKDRTEIIYKIVQVNFKLYIVISSITFVGILIALLLICFNYKYRELRFEL